jgi:rRNA biogenesis protein RRP5
MAADIDMRESTLVNELEGKIKFEDINISEKFEGTVMRVEEYGVFVRLENSDVSGLVHKSECSDKYIKSLSDLYDPGDLVKVLVLKKDDDKKQIGFSMKASYFDGDEELDDDECFNNEDSSVDELEGQAQILDDDELDSDDENFAAKLASQMSRVNEEEDGSSDSGDDDSSDISMSDANSHANDDEEKLVMDTNVGFDWSGASGNSKPTTKVSDDDTDSREEDEDGDDAQKSSHKSRKKQAQRRKEEQEISRRETALADGTADENPETAADFERLLAGDPNSSELWIRYMAFHLMLANVVAARDVADRAFARIEFRQEKEKLNVWCALLTLELKCGSEVALQKTLDRACQHNNPKHVYLRMCEMVEKQASSSSPDSIRKTDEMFAKMCKKFKDKKKVWIANMEYMLKNGRHEEAYSLSKRALLSLKPYKHVETMSKFAQLLFEYGSAEKARTVFDGLLLKYPKRLDLFFVYADKEVKHGDVEVARALFARVANLNDETLKMKLSDKQMKRFFKKWFTFEETHGTLETQERVKDAARAFVDGGAT